MLAQTHAGDKVDVGTLITLTVAQPIPPKPTPTPTPPPTPPSTPTVRRRRRPRLHPDRHPEHDADRQPHDVGSHQDHATVTGVLPGGPGWSGLAGWVAAQVSALGGVMTAAGRCTRRRIWSRAAAFGTTLGPVWFKVNAAGTAHEPRLHRQLARLVPDLLPAVLAVDEPRVVAAARRRADAAGPGGPGRAAGLVGAAAAALRRGAAGLAGHRDDLGGAGVPARSPATLPGQATALVAELATLEEDRGGLGPDRRAALEARLPAYGRWCAELAASGLPDTIQHDDLHPANVCVDGDGVRIIDWGDASLGHPFGTMLATLDSLVAHQAGLAPRAPLVLRLRDAYLEPFTVYAARRDLVRLVDRARQAGRVTRALAWRAALVAEPPEAHAAWDFPVRGWLEEILHD